MGLKEYARKRNFSVTPEPAPAAVEPEEKGGTGGGFFCVQRHDASRLHYDFRLEVGGVLVSWAVPKGPSLDPARKALAMKVEDHPFDYGTFEGNIPKGNYGGGSVMLWDVGTYNLLESLPAEKQLARGDFKFELHGKKLKGAFAIVQMKRAAKGNEWLLIKKKDDHAVPGYDIDQFAWSVATKRTQEEIAKEIGQINLGEIRGARKTAVPDEVNAMLATAVEKPPTGPHWLYEIKWDGIRALCFIKDGKLRISSRRGNRCDQQYPELADLPAHIHAKSAWLDGEICVLDEQGRARFQNIQPRIHANASIVPGLAESSPATLFLFDILYADGYDLRGAALDDRKKALNMLVVPDEHIRISESFAVSGDEIFAAARDMGLEGILAKDRRSTYEATRSRQWQKVKVSNEQEFVIAGFTEGEREYFAALVLGVYEGKKLRHAGQVGTGFDHRLMKTIYQRLEPLVTKASPLDPKPRIKGVTWVEPEIVCQVKFLEWTKDGSLRAPVFVGLRDDKAPQEVTREEPQKNEAPEDIEEPSVSESEVAEEPTPETDSRLDLSGKEVTVEVDNHRLKFSNLEKIYFPKDGWKKRDLLAFYDRVSEFLLPHLHDRPLSMKRYPNGIHADYFFQKNASTHFPEWMYCEPISEHGGKKLNHYPVAQNRASLLYLVNLGCIDQNPLMSRIENLEHPDWMLLDLDPVETSFDQIIDAMLIVREILAEVGLRGYPKTTGGDGMHIYVPLEPIYSFEQVRSFAELLSHLALERAPDMFTTPRSVEKRKKSRVYFDYLQIGTGKTIAAPYVVRAYDAAPVATPLEWKEVKRGLKPHDFRIENSPERFEKLGDIFAPVLEGGQRLEDALERLNGEKPRPPAKSTRKRAK